MGRVKNPPRDAAFWSGTDEAHPYWGSSKAFVVIFVRYVQDGAPKIAFSWFISGLTMVYGRYNELVNGDYNGL